MQLQTIVSRVNEKLAGEILTFEQLKVHLDAVIDDINEKLNAKFPVFSEFNFNNYPNQYPDYNFFPEKFIRQVVIPGAAFKFYTTDEEGSDVAQRYGWEYKDKLFIMERDYSMLVPEAFQETGQGYYENAVTYNGIDDNNNDW